MKIIKRGNPHKTTYNKICNSCESELEYDDSDIMYDRDDIYIVCPVCGKYLTHMLNIQTDRSRDC
jgi:predicted  nucleic acid-binding Zn-ribbon protein